MAIQTTEATSMELDLAPAQVSITPEILIYPVLKRGVDLVGAATGMLLLTALFPIIGLAIKLDSKGPVCVALDRVSCGKII